MKYIGQARCVQIVFEGVYGYSPGVDEKEGEEEEKRSDPVEYTAQPGYRQSAATGTDLEWICS